MKKLLLDLEMLRVDSLTVSWMGGEFATAIVDATRPQVCDPLTLRCA